MKGAYTMENNFYRDSQGIVWSILNEHTSDIEATLKRHLTHISRGQVASMTLYPVLFNNQMFLVFINIKGRVHYYREFTYNLGNNITRQLAHCRQNNQKQQITVRILTDRERNEVIRLVVKHNQDLLQKGILS